MSWERHALIYCAEKQMRNNGHNKDFRCEAQITTNVNRRKENKQARQKTMNSKSN